MPIGSVPLGSSNVGNESSRHAPIGNEDIPPFADHTISSKGLSTKHGWNIIFQSIYFAIAKGDPDWVAIKIRPTHQTDCHSKRFNNLVVGT